MSDQSSRICPDCQGTILSPTRGGVPRGSCHCPTNRSREETMTANATKDAPQAPEPTQKTPKPIAFDATGEARSVKSGTKLALLIDLLALPDGTTVEEIERELSRSGSKVDPKAWLGYDLRRAGYGVRQEGDRLRLVLPTGMAAPLAHKVAEPKKAPEAPVLQVVTEPRKKAAMTARKSKKAKRAKEASAK